MLEFAEKLEPKIELEELNIGWKSRSLFSLNGSNVASFPLEYELDPVEYWSSSNTLGTCTAGVVDGR